MASIYWVNLTTLILSFIHYSTRKLLSLLFITFRWLVGYHKVMNFVHLSLFQQYIFEYIYFRYIIVFINITKNEHYTRFLYGELISIKFCGFLTMCCQNNNLSCAPQFLFLNPQNTSLFHSLVLPDWFTSL